MDQEMELETKVDTESRLLKALAAGAAIAFQPNQMDPSESQKKVVAAYRELKEMIRNLDSQIDTTLLDIGPGSEERQNRLAQQLKETGAAQDEQLLKQAQAVLELINQIEPDALWAAEPADPPPQHK